MCIHNTKGGISLIITKFKPFKYLIFKKLARIVHLC